MNSTPKESKVQLEVFELESGGRKYQALAINLLEPKNLIEVSELELLEIPGELDQNREIILWGKAPIWLYGHLVWRFHNARWVACFNAPFNAAIVVSSHTPEIKPGHEFPITTKKVTGEAILICGAPDSGKSVLSYLLQKSLAAIKPEFSIYLHRANWDGEGNHTLENPDADLAKKLKHENKYKIHKHPEADRLLLQYFQHHAEVVKNIRQVVDLALIDVGGEAQEVKKSVIAECSYYIVISKYPERIQEWHNLCGDKLKLLAVIHSVWEEKLEVLQTEPYLEIIAGKWEKTIRVPDILLDEISNKLLSLT